MPTADEALQEAFRLCQAGKKNRAARMLIGLIRQDPAIEQAWWLLAGCLDDPARQRDCLMRVLQINPRHLGARVNLERLQNDLPLPDLCASETISPPDELAAPSSDAPPFHAHLPPMPDAPEVEHLLEHARAAEDHKDFSSAYELYNHVLDIDSSHLFAWLGKGYAAGRLSTPTENRIPEFFSCLTRAALARDPLGVSVHEAISRLDPQFGQAASECLLRLAGFAAQMALTTPQPMGNVYAVERVRLTDTAYTIGRRLSTQAGLWCSRAELIGVANDAFHRIIASVLDTNRSSRAREETLRALRGYLLSNLSASGINKDPDFLQVLDQMIQDALS